MPAISFRVVWKGCAAERADETATVVQERMQNAAQLRVPLTVDVGIGPNWADAK